MQAKTVHSRCARALRVSDCQIGGKLIPQNEVPQRLAEIDRDREIVVQCRSGGRSQRIAEFLKQSGYPEVVNLAGGMVVQTGVKSLG
jgi:rhodanese-related sulfurtransferase